MDVRRTLTVRLIGIAGVVIGVLCACSSEDSSATPSPEASFCSALTDAYAKCSGGKAVGCADTMRAECTKMVSLLNVSVLTGATPCIESATCDSDPLACLGRALVDAKPTSAQTKLATSFCESCAAVGGEPCKTAFFGTGSVPGLGVALLPFGDAPISAVDSACTKNPLGKAACQPAFPSCLSLNATKALAETVSPDAAKCLVTAIKDGLSKPNASRDGGTSDGGPGNGCEGCDGCCKDGTCVSGTETNACGTGGAGCESCSGTASCKNGQCVATCGPDNCAGCCDPSGNCQTGGATQYCGAGGGLCVTCTSSQTCEKGLCIEPTCKSTCTGCCTSSGCQAGNQPSACGAGGGTCADCGAGQTCAGGKCGLDPNTKWSFFLVSAELPTKNATGGEWDGFGGLPDVYVTATSGATTGSLPSVTDSLKPSWTVAAIKNVTASSLKTQTRLELFDDDVAFNDTIGVCNVVVSDADFDGSLRSFNCAASTGGVPYKVNYRLKPY